MSKKPGAVQPEPMPHLVAFYRRVRPGGPGWGPVAARAGGEPPERLREGLLRWAAGSVLVYATLFATGAALFGSAGRTWLWGGLAVAAGGWLYRDLGRAERRAAAS